MNADGGNNNISLIPRPPSAIEKVESGAKRVLTLMVSDTLAIAQQQLTPTSMAPTEAELESWCRQGERHFYGHGVPQDFTEAVKWYRKAAAHGYLWAQRHLGECCARGLGVQKDYAEAVKWFRKAAECGLGDGYPQSSLGYCYAQGFGVPQDYAEAARWYRIAAGSPTPAGGEAAIALGLLDLFGVGVPADTTETARWFAQATGMGVEEVQSLVVFFNNNMQLPLNLDGITPCLRECAERGETVAQLFLGSCYQLGWFVCPCHEQDAISLPQENQEEAVKWFRGLADHGHAEAQYRLAWCYFDTDRPEHEKWLKKAAAQGHRRASMGQGIHGVMFEGVPLL